MQPYYNWQTQGVTLLWNYDALMEVCKPKQVITLYQFFQHYAEKWANIDDVILNDRTLAVVGLEATFDSLVPTQIIDWIEETLYPAIRRYQQDVADGGSEASLVFFFENGKRFRRVNSIEHDYTWEAKDKSKIELMKAVFNGASSDAKTLTQNGDDDKPIGVYLRRIS